MNITSYVVCIYTGLNISGLGLNFGLDYIPGSVSWPLFKYPPLLWGPVCTLFPGESALPG